MKKLIVSEFNDKLRQINTQQNLLSIDYYYNYNSSNYENEVEQFADTFQEIIKSNNFMCFLITSSLHIDSKLSRKNKEDYGLSSGILADIYTEQILDFHLNNILKIGKINITSQYIDCMKYLYTGSHSISNSFFIVANKLFNISSIEDMNLYTPLFDRHGNFIYYKPNFEYIFNLKNKNLFCFFPLDGGFDIGSFSMVTNFKLK